jgi:predicted phage baseplate assembly protein
LPFDPSAPISGAFCTSPRDARPAITLREPADPEALWTAQLDLLSSDRFARHFVVEVDNLGRAALRFGDGVLGKEPDPARPLQACYRIGNGPDGNVGAESICHVVTPHTGITSVRNPMAASGGIAQEALDEVRLNAPVAFRTQERAMRVEDYAAIASSHPQVQQALATGRYTGSLYTIILAVQRKSGLLVDPSFVSDMMTYLAPYRRIGHELSVVAPIRVPLDILLTIAVAGDYVRSEVESALLESFGSSTPQGFFHPDRFRFGEPVYFSQLVRRAMQVPGVRFVRTDPGLTRFARMGQVDELASGAIAMRGLELPQVDNDPLSPQQSGRIRFSLQGGL